MDLLLTRKQFNKYGIFGQLCKDVGGIPYASAYSAYTGEHAYHDGTNQFSKIPPGSYLCVRGVHMLLDMTKPFETFEIKGVPNHTGLLFHAGNQPQIDSHGCILLGEEVIVGEQDPEEFVHCGADLTRDIHGLYESKAAFHHFMTFQQSTDVFKLTIIG